VTPAAIAGSVSPWITRLSRRFILAMPRMHQTDGKHEVAKISRKTYKPWVYPRKNDEISLKPSIDRRFPIATFDYRRVSVNVVRPN